ncbi:HTH domain-containing protein [Halopiger goleimassiliensis]|uniref:HTH domain-containing protein n=1 Tax=Halopiger goleimassiliensis TaxID=1293048 RepID=UPI0006780420|nr:HTH domain-containing protein [Halopiger goleimassiliensis]
MSPGEPTPVVPGDTDVDSADDLRVDCYVRPAVPAVITDAVTGVIDRLQHLDERDEIGDYRVDRWPPERHAVDDATEAATREDLVAAFECWASDHGRSLEPAFRRREVPTSPLGLEDSNSRERVRVPIVALALYEDDGREPASRTDASSLRWVVPHTDGKRPTEDRTYTVTDWLAAVEATGSGSPAAAARTDDRWVSLGSR